MDCKVINPNSTYTKVYSAHNWIFTGSYSGSGYHSSSMDCGCGATLDCRYIQQAYVGLYMTSATYKEDGLWLDFHSHGKHIRRNECGYKDCYRRQY